MCLAELIVCKFRDYRELAQVSHVTPELDSNSIQLLAPIDHTHSFAKAPSMSAIRSSGSSRPMLKRTRVPFSFQLLRMAWMR